MILVWGLDGDLPTMMVISALEKKAHPPTFFNQNSLLVSRSTWQGESLTLDGRVSAGQTTFDLRNVSSAYLRPYDTRTLFETRRRGLLEGFMTDAIAIEERMRMWADHASALMVNRPSAMASNNSKPLQSDLIRAEGFEVPETLVTTDPDAVGDFREKHQRVIYKSISSTRSIVASLEGEGPDRLGDVQWCPTQFQEFVEGVDYRVHVIAEQVFATRISSLAVDYRYASLSGAQASLEPCGLEGDLAERCIKLTKKLGLSFSGVDLRQSRSGKWYCFEVNPSPGFPYYQEKTGQPIDESIADFLINAEAN